VDPGLWALDFRPNGGSNSVPNGLYFTAGIAGPTNQSDGLFGYIAPIPEPSAYALAALGLTALVALGVARRRKATLPR
jgi:MYXO-CTERM domain-containing protein